MRCNYCAEDGGVECRALCRFERGECLGTPHGRERRRVPRFPKEKAPAINKQAGQGGGQCYVVERLARLSALLHIAGASAITAPKMTALNVGWLAGLGVGSVPKRHAVLCGMRVPKRPTDYANIASLAAI